MDVIDVAQRRQQEEIEASRYPRQPQLLLPVRA